MKTQVSMIVLVLLGSLVLWQPAGALLADERKVDGEQIFQQHCAQCHAGGGNSVKPNRPLAGSKQLAALATFKAYLGHPPGHMPYYPDVVRDKPTIEALWKYCKRLKKPQQQAYGAGTVLDATSSEETGKIATSNGA